MKAPPTLHIVADDEPVSPKPETVAARIKRLQAEAKALAKEHVRALADKLSETEALAREIAEGGGAYHEGAQERARRIAGELASQLLTLTQIMERT